MRIPKFPVIILALILVVPAAAWALGIRLNLTASLPLGLYIATSQPSDYVTFCVGDPWERIALERLYITPGHCPAGGIPLFKRIVARPGDLVTLDAWGISVNGRVLPRTAPMLADSSGRPMRHYPFGQLLGGAWNLLGSVILRRAILRQPVLWPDRGRLDPSVQSPSALDPGGSMQLRQGIPINQSPPSVYRANRRPLYIAIGTAGVVSILLIWAWVVRSNMRVIAQAKPTSSVAAPATSALKTLDKQWSEKLPKAPETLASAGFIRSASRPDRPGFRGAQHADLRYPASPPRPPSLRFRRSPSSSNYSHPARSGRPGTRRWCRTGKHCRTRRRREPPRRPWRRPPPPLPYPHAAGGERSPGDDYLSQNLQDSKKAFAGVGRNTLVPIAADGGRLPPYIVKAGWDIPAILEQSANSDLPGELRARVRENVYDTATGRYLLIPQNSILAGKYNSDVAYAQNRIQVNWDRLIRPGNEPTIYLNQMNGVDDSGNAGLTGPVTITTAGSSALRCSLPRSPPALRFRRRATRAHMVIQPLVRRRAPRWASRWANSAARWRTSTSTARPRSS